MLCLEHVGATRTWTVDEQNFALSVANLVAAATAEEDRRQAVQQLAESESRSRLVIDTATDAFVAMDSDGTIVGWNLQSERTFGWSRQEAIGRLLVETIVPQNYRDLHIRGLERFHKTGEAPVVNKLLELTALHRSGKEFPIELAITEPIRSGNGFYFGAFLRDISERRLRERELQNAKEAAEAAARAKSEFLANMSHELRTPLNGVLGYAQLLRRDRSLSSANLDAIESISTCGEHLLNLINDVLDLSKIEAGRVEIDAESTDLRELIADLRLLVTESARAKGLALEFMIASDLPNRVVIDGRHLRQVLLNLISNAVKFTERGSVRLTITRLESSICFEVIDTGIGIDDQDLESIFEAFRQGGAAATRGGTGLGLTISRRLVRAMGGEIRVKSKRDSGSRFWFLVPLVPDTRPEEPHAEEASRDLRLSPGQDATVLVVDDSTINRRIMASLLESGGIKALHAASGLDGVRIAQEQRPDLILMDVRMSDIDGFEATRRIRSITSTATIPVIAVTASPDAGNRDLALAAGCNGFLAKPLKASELYGILSHELNLKFEPLDKSDKAIQASARSIPVPLADRITRAAHMGDLTELHALAKELMSGEKPAADAGRYVSKLANAFEFEAIERWIAESRNERGSGE